MSQNQIIATDLREATKELPEPRGHISPGQFDAEIKCCQLAGFRKLDTPDPGKRSMAALLAPGEREV